VLAYALSSPSISKITILSRRPVKLAENEPKAKVILHTDYERYSEEVLRELKGASGCVWAQGISSRGMNEPDYTKITVDYPVAAAKALATMDRNMNFVYFSGEGADTQEKATMLFGRVKGRAENALLKLQDSNPMLRVYNIRPAIINPQGRYLAERKVTMQDTGSTFLGGLCEKVWKSFVIPSDGLAKVCVDLAIGDGEPVQPGTGVELNGRLLRNTALRRLAGMSR